MNRRPRKTLAAALSVGLHLAAAALLAFVSVGARAVPRAPKPLQRQAVSLRALSTSEWSANRGAPSAAPKRTGVAAPKKREEVPKGQVVDVAPGNGQQAADAKYLAETSNTTAKQTRARETSPNYGTAMPQTSTATPQTATQQAQVRPPQTKGNNGRGNEEQPRRESGAVSGRSQTPNTQRKDALAMRSTERTTEGVNLSGQLAQRTRWGESNRFSLGPNQTSRSEAEGSEGKQGAEGEDQVSSPAVLAYRSGAAPNDHLGGLDEGDGTFLNTREWKFAGFFNRVKQAVSAHWKPNAVLERHPVDGTRTRVTVVNVSLDEQGRVKQMHVESSSGDSSLDAEAVAAFERSQPFPNPPTSLMGADAAIHFSFGFYMEMNGTAQFRPFRFGR